MLLVLIKNLCFIFRNRRGDNFMNEILSEELKARLMKAENAEEIEEILVSSGNEVTKEEAERIFAELEKHSGSREVSVEEMEAAGGGFYQEGGLGDSRDWAKEGCAATVEAGSWCWSNDKCLFVVNSYTNPPSKKTCAVCGGRMYIYDKKGVSVQARYYLRCANCGAEHIQGA